MAKKKEEELFNAWVAETKAKLSDEAKTHFDSLLSDEAGAKEVFRGGLREADYYRRLNELSEAKNSWEQEKTQIRLKWDEEKPKNERLLKAYNDTAAELEAAKEQLETLGFGEEGARMTRDVKSNPDSVTREEHDALKSQLQLFNQVLPKILKDVSTVTHRIIKDNWDTDAGAVIDYALTKGVDPNQAFLILTQEQREERAEKDLKEKVEKAREEGRREALNNATSPDHLRQPGPTPADFINSFAPRTESRDRIAAAVKGFDSALEAIPQ